MALATVPAAPPTWKNQRATSWPPPTSAMVPYDFGSRLTASAFWPVVGCRTSMGVILALEPLPVAEGKPKAHWNFGKRHFLGRARGTGSGTGTGTISPGISDPGDKRPPRELSWEAWHNQQGNGKILRQARRGT